ncbi:MAG: imidazole glycerol phosphate synthase subunit HisH [Armatimonadetes bacterium]|nr:MAG: imidazole glycerol phosphate synthase subunit HisH [Armatimonadota bacterium]
MSNDVIVVPTGTANTASVLAAFGRLGVRARVSTDPDEIGSASGVVMPGVGTFGAAIGEIDRIGVRQALLERIEADKPTMAICVGLQMFAETSEESPGVRGLGVVASDMTRFPSLVAVPQLGWNMVEGSDSSRFVRSGWAYFANSYRLATAPGGWIPAMATHGGPFVAAIERGNVLACQFHPELSGPWGLAVIDAWIDATKGTL